MPNLVKVGPVADIPPGKCACVKVGKEDVAVFNCDGAFYAISDMCPHAGAPLSQGFVDGSTVTCAWHGWAFEMDAAKCQGPDGLDRYDVVIQDDIIYVQEPE